MKDLCIVPPELLTLRFWCKTIILCLGLLAVSGCAGAGKSASVPDLIPPVRWQVLEDASATADIEQILARRDQFRDVGSATANFNYSSSACWLRTQVENQAAKPVTLYLEEKNPLQDSLTLYIVHSDSVLEIVRSGDMIPASQRPYAATNLVLPFQMEGKQSVQLYLRARSDAAAMLLPLEVMDADTLRLSLLGQDVFHGMMLGLFGALFIYNLFVLALLRTRTYLYYVIYLPIAYLATSALDGFGSAFFYRDNVWIGNYGLVIFAGLSFTLVLLFTRSFLRTAEYHALDRGIKVLIGVSVLISIAPVVLPIQLAYVLGQLMIFAFPFVSVFIGMYMLRRGRKEARFYVLGQVTSWAGLLTFGLMIFGMLPFHFLINESITIGIAGDALLLSLALADRIRILQREKLAAENLARKNLELRQDELEQIVTQRTVELDAARKQAERLATTDYLTGIHNRRGLIERAEKELQRAQRTGHPLSVITFDLDHFKRVNDQHGHAEGDRALRRVASVVGGVIRPTDLFGRIGGEEFLLVLPDTSGEDALEIAERLRQEIANQVRVGAAATTITASFGVAWLTPTTNLLDSLQSAADEALYSAKQNGRNRVELGKPTRAPNPSLRT